ncbi:hypothetical protein F5051DRAFT_307038, partial [Lentinula edodes]
GRPSVFTQDDIAKAISSIDEGRAVDGSDLQAQLFPTIPQRTVRRMLSHNGLKGFVRRQKVTLNMRN